MSHRGFAAARLKDSYPVNMELKQFLEQGYVGPILRGSHNPYTGPMPDRQGSIPTLIIEMLLYSRPGAIDVPSAGSPSVPYKDTIAPLVPYAIRGVIWDQGESGFPDGRQHRTVMESLIKEWREVHREHYHEGQACSWAAGSYFTTRVLSSP